MLFLSISWIAQMEEVFHWSTQQQPGNILAVKECQTMARSTGPSGLQPPWHAAFVL